MNILANETKERPAKTAAIILIMETKYNPQYIIFG